jgi:threonine dehydrogenase-like Zn-dependent dehydrogenase
LIQGGRLDATPFATHRFQLEDTMEAYDVFTNAAKTQAQKIVLSGLPVEPVKPTERMHAAARA